MADKQEFLRMTFDPNTIQHLGIKMYSQLPAAIAELVANAYDADAREVYITLSGGGEDKKIEVSDDGHGMSFDEVNDYFLKIGRNRRDEKLNKSPGGRTATGKKGLGKLALFGIGERVQIRTKKKGETEGIQFSLVWQDLKKWNKEKDGPDYRPRFETFTSDSDDHWTEIIISSLKRKTDFSVEDLPVSLSRMFNFLDKNFQVFLRINEKDPIQITNELKYSSLIEQFKWEFPEFVKKITEDYPQKNEIRGRVITTKLPLKPGQRGITLFANGRMVNAPEFFGISESSNFFSYATGWLDINFIDADFGTDDSISTNRQSLDWDMENTSALRIFLQKVVASIHQEWREKRKEENKKDAQAETGINRDVWFGTIPDDKASVIGKALEDISDPDSEKNYTEIVERALHEIAPEYAEKHWRYLCPRVSGNEVIGRLYQGKNYFQAASEAVKLYIEEVRKVSQVNTGTEKNDYILMGRVFGWQDKGERVKEISLTKQADLIERDIEQGHKHYSEGVVVGFKNPVTSHATEQQLKERGLFTEKDCLDILSLVCHLFVRLDKRVTPPK